MAHLGRCLRGSGSSPSLSIFYHLNHFLAKQSAARLLTAPSPSGYIKALCLISKCTPKVGQKTFGVHLEIRHSASLFEMAGGTEIICEINLVLGLGLDEV